MSRINGSSTSRQSPASTATTATSSISTTSSSCAFETSQLNDIDGDESYIHGDDDDDEESNVSDLDSILAMAKRLDDASIISDPSIIEGTTPHIGIGNQRYRRERGGGIQYKVGSSSGRGRRGGLYADNQRDLDSIASESEEDEVDDNSSSSSSSSSESSNSSGTSDSRSSRSSDTSMERNVNRGKQNLGGACGSRPMGQPRVGFHGDNDHPFHHTKNHHQNHRHRHYRQQEHAPYVSEKDIQRSPNDQYANQRRGGGGIPSSSRSANISSATTSSSSVTSRGKFYANSKSNGVEQEDVEERKQRIRRKLKIAMIPIFILLVVVAIIAVVISVKNSGNNNENEQLSTSVDDNNTDEYQISIPTSSPTYSGLYDCPLGKSGAVPIRGCAGFVVCNSLGEAIEPIRYCGQGTLYDVYTNVCNHVDSVVCSTPSLPPAMVSSLSPGLILSTTAPAPAPTSTVIDSFPSLDTTVTFKPTNAGELTGPTTTNDQRLDFLGVSSPGDVTILQISLQNYLNNFYSSSNLDTLDKDDVLRSLSDVSITLTVTDFENRKRRRILVHDIEENTRRRKNVKKMAKIRGKRVDRNLQSNIGSAVVDPRFILIYDQTTTYRTTDVSISIETILSRPFDEGYTSLLIDQLQQRDPDTYSTLTGVEFIDSGNGDGVSNAVTTTAPSATLPRTKRPSLAPTVTIEDDNQESTLSPTQAEAPPPPTAQPVAEIPPVLIINGITWLDKNENGLYERNIDLILDEVFVNLRQCDGDVWMNTTKTDSSGQYSFPIEEGEYYLEFYKPSPSEKYDFTKPRVGVDDTEVLDSDVVEVDEIQGKTNCMTMTEGFSQLTNAGYKDISSSDESTPSPSPPILTAPATGTTASQYCAFVTFTGSGGRVFDFDGCSLRCSNPDRACPNGMLCAYTNDC